MMSRFPPFAFVELVEFVGVWSKHRIIFGCPRQSSEIFGNLRKMSGNVHLAIGIILENLQKSLESDRKYSEICQKRRHQHVYIIERTLHVSSKIWILCSSGKNYISRVSAATQGVQYSSRQMSDFWDPLVRGEEVVISDGRTCGSFLPCLVKVLVFIRGACI